MNLRQIPLLVVSCMSLLEQSAQQVGERQELFKAELFLNSNDLNAGLYEGEVKGRRRFGDSQVPHGFGTIYFFTTDKFNRVNYTGNWAEGEREGNGTTSFKDGAVYEGDYKQGLEDGPGFIRYPNGNTLDAEFVAGKIQGHGVFRYDNGDQREGFFQDNILDGQVIFTRRDGVTLIEQWVDGKQVQQAVEEALQVAGGSDSREDVDILLARNEIQLEGSKPKNPAPNSQLLSPAARGGSLSASWGKSVVDQTDRTRTAEATRLGQLARSRARSFLFDIFRGVNTG
eukprot:GFUD01016839.1.p1 GENE.GFUD01016839.1~~GFUD01016839.1.p1  ORF type:complete len:285 (+),score=83.93 GFUD01016839.1:464-1318(+)